MTEGISLAGRRILLVEDNFHIADAMARVLAARGAEIIGPAGNVKAALALIAAAERIDGATLDINLRGGMAYPIIDALRAKSVRMVVMTGYDASSIREGYADLPVLQKPVKMDRLIELLLG